MNDTWGFIIIIAIIWAMLPVGKELDYGEERIHSESEEDSSPRT